MTVLSTLVPLEQIPSDQKTRLAIQQNDLLPLLDNPSDLSRYADALVQAQAVLLTPIDPELNQQLNRIIAEIIAKLARSDKTLKKRKFSALQRWLGIDIEHDQGQLNYFKALDLHIEEARVMSRRIKIEVEKSQSRVQQFLGLREKMAAYIQAAREFAVEYPRFVKHAQPFDQFFERLQKKINTLATLQASNDIALMQMQLNQQLSLTLLDRFQEAEQILIPAWQYHVKQSVQDHSVAQTQKLEHSRTELLNTLQRSLDNNRAQ